MMPFEDVKYFYSKETVCASSIKYNTFPVLLNKLQSLNKAIGPELEEFLLALAAYLGSITGCWFLYQSLNHYSYLLKLLFNLFLVLR